MFCLMELDLLLEDVNELEVGLSDGYVVSGGMMEMLVESGFDFAEYLELEGLYGGGVED